MIIKQDTATWEDTTDPRVGTTFRQDSYTVRVDTELDTETDPSDFDCYTATQLAGYRAGAWGYVGTVVTVTDAYGHTGTASLWSIESGWFVGTSESDAFLGQGYVGPDTLTVDDLIAEAISQLPHVYTLAEIRNGTGFARDAKFIQLDERSRNAN